MLAAGAVADPTDPRTLDDVDDAGRCGAATRCCFRVDIVVRHERERRPLRPVVSSEQAQELLKGAGLSGYEAKAYLALLAGGEPMNGYEVAKASGVPRSTVYETLGKLVARGAAFEVNGDGGTRRRTCRCRPRR